MYKELFFMFLLVGDTGSFFFKKLNAASKSRWTEESSQEDDDNSIDVLSSNAYSQFDDTTSSGKKKVVRCVRKKQLVSKKAICSCCCKVNVKVVAQCKGDSEMVHAFCKKCFLHKKLCPYLMSKKEQAYIKAKVNVAEVETKLSYVCPFDDCMGLINLKFLQLSDLHDLGMQLKTDSDGYFYLVYVNNEYRKVHKAYYYAKKCMFLAGQIFLPVCVAGITALVVLECQSNEHEYCDYVNSLSEGMRRMLLTQ